jgi:hypothetical protein
VTDDRLRRLEREAAQSTDPVLEARRLRELLRAGKLPVERLELAAWLGHAPAREALDPGAPGSPEEFAEWARGLERFGREACVRAFVAGARASLLWRGRFEGPEDRNTLVVEIVESRARGSFDAGLLALLNDMNREDEPDVPVRADEVAAPSHFDAFFERDIVEGLVQSARACGLDDVRWWVREDLVPWALGERDPLALRQQTHGRRFGHERDIVRSVGFSPDGTRVISSSSAGTITLWDVERRERVRSFERQRRDVFAATFSPDGATILTGGFDGRVVLWDVESGHELAVLRHASSDDDETVNDVAFVSRGRIATAGHDQRVKVWDLARPNAPALVLEGHERGVGSIAVSHDGRSLASGSADSTVRVWDLATGEKVMVGRGHGTSSVEGVGWLPDGRVVSAGYDGKLAVWDVAAAAVVGEVQASRHASHGLAVSRDGRFAAIGGGDASIALVDLASREVAREWRWLTSLTLALAFSPDGKLVLAGEREGGLRTFAT